MELQLPPGDLCNTPPDVLAALVDVVMEKSDKAKREQMQQKLRDRLR